MKIASVAEARERGLPSPNLHGLVYRRNSSSSSEKLPLPIIAVRFGDNLEMARGLLLPRAIASGAARAPLPRAIVGP